MVTALVVGGGVAGPVAAMALQRAGVNAVVFEGRPADADDGGAFLTLQINGMDALRAVDAYDVVSGLGFPTPLIHLHNHQGRLLGTVPTGGTAPDGTTSHTVRRADLHRALRDEAARRGIPIHHGRRVVGARTDGRGVTAQLDDGSAVTGDLLVGCDGVHSRIRQVVDPSAPAPRFVPLLNLGGYATGVDTGVAPGEFHMVFGRRAFLGHVTAPDGVVWWFANLPCRQEPDRHALRAVTTEQWRRRLTDLFADDRSPGVELVRATDGPLDGWATYDLPRVPVWHRGRMVVIGDAAHAASPSSGQGASMAIEDAVHLGRCLRDHADPPVAFAAYDALRRARVERVVAHGARSSSDKVAGPVGRRIRDLVMPLFVRRLTRDDGAALAWLHDHHIDWEAPVGV